MYMENNLTVFDIANYFSSKEDMTHKKLQKLVYYAYAWYIALNNEVSSNIIHRLCSDTSFEAWVHGPVCRDLYSSYAGLYYVGRFDGRISENITEDIADFLDRIYDVFGGFSGDQLESMTHQEKPWLNARNGASSSSACRTKISEKDMFTYYNSL